MAAPSPDTRSPGTRSTEAVRDAGQLDFFRSLWTRAKAAVTAVPAADATEAYREELLLAPGPLVVIYARHPRAKRYRLLFRRDGTARCTVPRRGTLAEAKRFVAENDVWLTERLRKHLGSARAPRPLRPGGTVLVGGEEAELRVETGGGEAPAVARLPGMEFPVDLTAPDLRPQVDLALRKAATASLPKRTQELALAHGLEDRIRRVSVRDQRTRWGSCSRRGVISLNWRLVQVPESVRDYIILHELAHLKHMDHSARFWAEVARICPGHETSEAWLKQHGKRLL